MTGCKPETVTSHGAVISRPQRLVAVPGPGPGGSTSSHVDAAGMMIPSEIWPLCRLAPLIILALEVVEKMDLVYMSRNESMTYLHYVPFHNYYDQVFDIQSSFLSQRASAHPTAGLPKAGRPEAARGRLRRAGDRHELLLLSSNFPLFPHN